MVSAVALLKNGGQRYFLYRILRIWYDNVCTADTQMTVFDITFQSSTFVLLGTEHPPPPRPGLAYARPVLYH